MRPIDLTSKRVTLADGSSVLPYQWNGEEVLVCDNALVATKIFLMFRDQDMEQGEKAARIISLMFADPDDAFMACDYSPEEFGKLVNSVIWDVYGIDNTGRRTQEPMWDIEEDAAFIRASLRMAYDIDWDEQRERISWAELVYLIASLPYETPLGMRMYYRNKENRPKRTKHNKEQVAEFDRLHKLFALKKPTQNRGSHDSAEVANSKMNDFAMALGRQRTR